MPLTHHTKNKGDLGVAKAQVDLIEQGFVVLLPMTEHAPFDLVAYADNCFLRLQVKYRTTRKGALTVHFRSVWSDQHGVKTRPMDKTGVDIVCVYCPETDECYYVRPIDHPASVTLRVLPARNGQFARVKTAMECRSLRAVAGLPVLAMETP